MALYELLRSPMRAWYAQMLGHAPLVPSPRSGFFAGSSAPTADRVLLVGNGPVHGWGVLTHEISLVGQLAGMLQARTGRETGVEFVGDERMTVSSASTWVGERAADGYDLAVIAVGLNDALRLTPVARFAEQYRRLVQQVRAGLPGHAELVLVTLPHPRAYSMAHGWLGRVAERHAATLSAQIRLIGAETADVRVVEAPVEHFEPGFPLGSRQFFQDLGDQLAREVLPALQTAWSKRTAPLPTIEHSTARVLASSPDPVLDELMQDAQQRFGVSVAAVNLIDGDRIWCAGVAGPLPMQLPAPLVYCSVVAACDDDLVIPNRYEDSRFDGNTFLEVVDLPFYAGVPLRDINGQPIGAVCMLDAHPHSADYVPLDRLREVATQVEARLAERLTQPLIEPAQPV